MGDSADATKIVFQNDLDKNNKPEVLEITGDEILMISTQCKELQAMLEETEGEADIPLLGIYLEDFEKVLEWIQYFGGEEKKNKDEVENWIHKYLEGQCRRPGEDAVTLKQVKVDGKLDPVQLIKTMIIADGLHIVSSQEFNDGGEKEYVLLEESAKYIANKISNKASKDVGTGETEEELREFMGVPEDEESVSNCTVMPLNAAKDNSEFDDAFAKAMELTKAHTWIDPDKHLMKDKMIKYGEVETMAEANEIVETIIKQEKKDSAKAAIEREEMDTKIYYDAQRPGGAQRKAMRDAGPKETQPDKAAPDNFEPEPEPAPEPEPGTETDE